MNVKPLLLIDIDDVIIDTRPILERKINEKLDFFGLTQKVILKPEGDWENPVMWGVPETEKAEAFEKLLMLFEEATREPFPMIDGADIAIDKLSESFKIAFLTSRPESYRENTVKQLITALGEERVKNIEVYHNGIGGKTKGELIKELEESGEYVWGLIDNQKRHVDSAVNLGYNGIIFGVQGGSDWNIIIEQLV